jgi:hypothetical protein
MAFLERDTRSEYHLQIQSNERRPSVREGRSLVRRGHQICALGRCWKETKSTCCYPGNTVTVTSLAFQSIGCLNRYHKESPRLALRPPEADFDLKLVGSEDNKLARPLFADLKRP